MSTKSSRSRSRANNSLKSKLNLNINNIDTASLATKATRPTVEESKHSLSSQRLMDSQMQFNGITQSSFGNDSFQTAEDYTARLDQSSDLDVNGPCTQSELKMVMAATQELGETKLS